jgi:hypothetical protein
VPLEGVPTLEEIRRRVIREIVDSDIQSARRHRRRRGGRAARAGYGALHIARAFVARRQSKR